MPVYDAEESPRRCLDSIRCQSWREIEVLLVNDGSTDGSRAICREYCERDQRFHLIDQERNSGVADSRNRAIAAATGKYLQFADSDDWLRSDATERMAEAAEQSGSNSWWLDFTVCWSGAFMRTARCLCPEK